MRQPASSLVISLPSGPNIQKAKKSRRDLTSHFQRRYQSVPYRTCWSEYQTHNPPHPPTPPHHRDIKPQKNHLSFSGTKTLGLSGSKCQSSVGVAQWLSAAPSPVPDSLRRFLAVKEGKKNNPLRSEFAFIPSCDFFSLSSWQSSQTQSDEDPIKARRRLWPERWRSTLASEKRRSGGFVKACQG